MSQYKMDINGMIGLSDYSNIHDYISIIDKNDNFTITLDDSARNSLDIIQSMLKDSKFYIADQGVDDEGKYYMNAQKNKINDL